MYEPLEQVAYSDKGSLYGVTSPCTRLELSRPRDARKRVRAKLTII